MDPSTVRRAAAVLAAAAALAGGPAAAAPSSAAVTDARGDWSVASADITGIRVTSTPATRGKPAAVTLELSLAAAPDGVAQYALSFSGAGACDNWDVLVRGAGTPAQSATWQPFCHGAGPLVSPPAGGSPATAVVKGSTLAVTVPYAQGVKRGLHVRALYANALTAPVGVCAGTAVVNDCVITGDIAGGRVSYVLR